MTLRGSSAHPDRRRLARRSRLVGLSVAIWIGLALALTGLSSSHSPAQGQHTHSWTVGDALDGYTLAAGDQSIQTGQVTSIGVWGAAAERDVCVAEGQCDFWGGWAYDEVHPTMWSASLPGDFGFFDGLGQFVISTDPSLVTHFRGGSTEGECTITVTIDDSGESIDPNNPAGPPIPTFDDASVSLTTTIALAAAGSHSHSWSEGSALQAPQLWASRTTLDPGDVVPIGWDVVEDFDSCGSPVCSFPFGFAANAVTASQWSDGAAGGQFGFVDSMGQFVASSDPSLVSHYKCPNQLGAVTLQLTVDDAPQAVDPNTGSSIATFDDAAVAGSLTLDVSGIGVHSHDWEPEANIPPAELSIRSLTISGQLYFELSILPPTDWDLCLDPGQSGCSFPGDLAPNLVIPTGWSDGGAGGAFGYLDGLGQFVPSTNPAEIHLYRPGIPEPPPTTITVNLDDVPEANDRQGRPGFTYDDPPTSTSGQAQPPVMWHQHQFIYEPSIESKPPIIVVSNQTPTSGSVIEIAYEKPVPGYDMDQCIAATSANFLCKVDGFLRPQLYIHTPTATLGQLGYYIGTQFIVTSTASEVTHFVCPVVTEPTEVKLRVMMGDELAGLDRDGNWVNGVDDPDAQGEVTLIVYPPGYGSDGMGGTLVGSRTLSGDQVCNCGCAAAPIHSTVDPRSGAVSFDIPISSWQSRGRTLGFSLSFNSGARVSPELDRIGYPLMEPEPQVGHVGHRNQHFTHNWAQFIEVVQTEGGEAHALWHTGDGGIVGFDFQAGTPPSGEGSIWLAHDSFHSLTDKGATTVLGPSFVGGAAMPFPYGRFTATTGDGTKFEFNHSYLITGGQNIQREYGAGGSGSGGSGGVNVVSLTIPVFHLTRVVDRWGREVNLTWNNEQLVRVEDQDGRGLSFAYSQPPWNGSATSPGGAFGGVLTQVTDAAGRIHRFQYRKFSDEVLLGDHRFDKLVGITAAGPYGLERKWSFDWQHDRLIKKAEPAGRLVTYAYEPRLLQLDGFGQTYKDYEGRLVGTSAAGPGEAGTGILREVLVPDQQYALLYPMGNRVVYTYGAGSRVSQIQDPATGRGVAYTYDAWGNVTTVASPVEVGSPLVQIEYTYAADGRRISKAVVRDLEGHEVETTFGDWNLPLATESRTTPGGPWTQRTLYTRGPFGNVVEMKSEAAGSPLNFVTRFFDYYYDDPTRIIDPLGNDSLTTLDPLTGNPIAVASPQNLRFGSPLDRDRSVSQVEYNAAGIPIRFRDPLNRQVTLTYESVSLSNPGALPEPGLKVTSRAVGTDGQIVLSMSAILDSEGRVRETVDSQGIRGTMTYSSAGQLLSATEAVGTELARTTSYSYDGNGQLTSILRPNGVRTVFERWRYSRNGSPTVPLIYEGEMTAVKYAAIPTAGGGWDGGREEYRGCNSAGEVEWISRPFRQASGIGWNTVEVTRDSLHRVTQVDYPNSPQGVPGFAVTTAYDAEGNVSHITDASGTTTYLYDSFGRVRRVEPSGGRRGISIQYEMVQGRWIERTLMDGVGGTNAAWQSAYDQKGRLVELLNPLGQRTTWEYNLAGQVLLQRNANGTTSGSAYDPAGRLITASDYTVGAGGAASHLQSTSYTYGPSGKISGSQTIAGSQITQRAFGYDTLGRLVSEGTSTHLATELPNWQITGYRYDTGDNRVVVTRGNRTEYYGRNALDQIIWMNTGGPAAPQPGQAADYRVFVYDGLGQLIQREMGGGSSQTTSIQDIYDLKWDSDGRLREIAARGRTNGVTLSALYAADGDRVQKSDPVNGVKLDSFGLHQRYSNTTGETHTNLQTPGISTRTQRGATLKDRYFHTDHLGSTQHLTDGSGGGTAVTTPWRTSFDAFGRSLGSAGSDGADATEFQWGGQWGYQREPGALGFGLDYIYQRYYDPELGRFISPDPIGLAGGLNLYAYCDNDPINAVDPSGEYLVRIGNDMYDFTVEGVVKGLNTGARAALEAMSGGLIDAGSAKCEPGYQGASLLAGAGSALFSVIGVGQGVMAVRAAGGVRAAAVAAWNAAKARPKQIAAAARGIRDSVRGTAARVKALTGPNCFVAGTPVAIPGGSKPIEKLKRGDLVLSRDPNTGRATTRRVVEATRRTADSVLTLELSASKGGPVLHRLTGTPEHPFFIEGGGMRVMGELGIGTSIVTRAGPPLVVTSLKREGRPNGVQVYNLEVEADHTYFVGTASGGTWVHNTCDPTLDQLRRAYEAATAPYKDGQLTVSARALDKHGRRAATSFPTPMGSVHAKNELAHDIVGGILGNPESILLDHGAVFDIVSPSGQGIRFWKLNGSLKGFLEPVR